MDHPFPFFQKGYFQGNFVVFFVFNKICRNHTPNTSEEAINCKIQKFSTYFFHGKNTWRVDRSFYETAHQWSVTHPYGDSNGPEIRKVDQQFYICLYQIWLFILLCIVYLLAIFYFKIYFLICHNNNKKKNMNYAIIFLL